MSKTTKNEDAEAKMPGFLNELKEKGTVTLTATSREELADIVADIPADIRYGAGAVGKTVEGGYSLRLDIV